MVMNRIHPTWELRLHSSSFFPEELVLMNAETEPFTAVNVWLCSFWTQVVSTILQHSVIIRLVSLL